MTPNDIQVLLHCYCSPEPHPRLAAPAVSEAVNAFIKSGILAKHDTDELRYKPTAKGEALIQMLCKTPLPEQVYVDPRFKQEEH